jgi:hypothetical protein
MYKWFCGHWNGKECDFISALKALFLHPLEKAVFSGINKLKTLLV